ncbi:hypothetical protein, partial [Bacillus velezensis]|uniref:hypothetical protein n=1 Tax=Bacillus velezensis TaxID=492670 RepID=UPI0037C03B5E
MATTTIRCLYFQSPPFTTYHYLIPLLHPPLPFIFTLIFFQTLPIFTIKKLKQSLKIQQIISFIIFIASLLTPL